ncbi:MAG TPA: SRPBCC family protein [Saprospiraceae bacterium]
MKLTFAVNKSPEFIFDYLTDMDKFVSVHPLISKIENLGDNHFRVHETLKFWFIPYSFTYPVTIQKNVEEKKIVMKAVIQKMTHIEMHFTIRDSGHSSSVEEDISIKTFLPVKGFIRKIFKKQHELMFRNIDKL